MFIVLASFSYGQNFECDLYKFHLGTGFGKYNEDRLRDSIWLYYYLQGEPVDKRSRIKYKVFYEEDTVRHIEAFHENGKLLCDISFVNGKRNGEVIFFRRNGSISMISNYKYGLLDGDVRLFYQSGRLEKKVQFKEGLLHGDCTGYYDNKSSTLRAKGTFVSGIGDGEYVFYTPTGASIKEYFIKGKPAKNQVSLDKYGKLEHEIVWCEFEGAYVKSISYDEDGEVKDQFDIPYDESNNYIVYGGFVVLNSNCY